MRLETVGPRGRVWLAWCGSLLLGLAALGLMFLFAEACDKV